MKINVGVFFGGESVEHEVSIISAMQAMDAIDLDIYEVIPVYISKDSRFYTGKKLRDIETYKDLSEINKKSTEISIKRGNNSEVILSSSKKFKKDIRIDIAFPVIHGTNGEDGSLSGLFELIGLPYVGCDIAAAVVGQDKVFMKNILRDSGIPICNYVWFYGVDFEKNENKILEKASTLTYPRIVKPASTGSSVGISKATNDEELIESIKEAMQYDKKIIIEEMIEELIEVNCSVIGDYEDHELSALEEVMGNDEFLSFQDKYLGNGKGSKGSKGTKGASGMASTSRVIPARISEKMTAEVYENASLTFKALMTSGVCRIDFLIDNASDKVYVNEINTIPGSLAFYLWKPVGKSFTQLTSQLLKLAVKRERIKTKQIYKYDSNILSNYSVGSKGSKT